MRAPRPCQRASRGPEIKKSHESTALFVLHMAPKHNRIIECLLGDRRWAVPCVAPPDASSARVFLLRLPEPCIVTDVALDTRLPCCISDADICCPQLDESQGDITRSRSCHAPFRLNAHFQVGAAPKSPMRSAADSWVLLRLSFFICNAKAPLASMSSSPMRQLSSTVTRCRKYQQRPALFLSSIFLASLAACRCHILQPIANCISHLL